MNKTLLTTIGAMLLTGVALPALAFEPADQVGPNTEARVQQGTVRQQVAGTVTDLNYQNGAVSLGTPDGTLELHYPPAAMRDLKKGDRITAHFSVAKSDSVPGGMRAYDAPAADGGHQMTGMVGDIDNDKGWITVKTDPTVLKLHFPSGKLNQLKLGDRVTVDMSFTQDS